MTAQRILAIETSGRCGSAALAEGPYLRAERAFETHVEHAAALLPCVDDLCRRAGWRPAELQQLHVSIGPGSFTGLRVAVAFTRHLALAVDCRIVAVPTLDVIAQNALGLAPPPTDVVVLLSAKRDQVFAAQYVLDRSEHSSAHYRRVRGPDLADPAVFIGEAPPGSALLGEGCDHLPEGFRAAHSERVLDRALGVPRAAHVHGLGWTMACAGQFVAPQDLTPLYIRQPEAVELWERRNEASTPPI